MALFPSEQWLADYVARINSSSAYAAAAATWEGDLVFVYEAEPAAGVPEDRYAWLDLWHGRCRSARMLDGPEDPQARTARFTIRAPYGRWKQVLRKELDPIAGMMQGKLRVSGDLPTIIRYVKAANVLVELASQVDTQFADEV